MKCIHRMIWIVILPFLLFFGCRQKEKAPLEIVTQSDLNELNKWFDPEKKAPTSAFEIPEAQTTPAAVMLTEAIPAATPIPPAVKTIASVRLFIETSPGTTITLTHNASAETISKQETIHATTSSSGASTLSVLPGSYRLDMSNAHYEPYTTNITVDSDTLRITQPLIVKPALLQLQSSISMEIWEDRQLLGMTGQTLTNLTPGMHFFTLKSPVSYDMETRVHLQPGEQLTQQITDIPFITRTLFITFQSDYSNDTWLVQQPKKLFVDDEITALNDTLKAEIQLPLGEHRLRADVPGYESLMQSNVTITADGRHQSIIRCRPLPAQFHVRCRPEQASISINTLTPAQTNHTIALPPFVAHRLILSARGFAPLSIDLDPFMPGSSITSQLYRLPKTRQIEDLIIQTNLPAARSTIPFTAGEREIRRFLTEYSQKMEMPLSVTTARSGIDLRLIPPGQFMMGSPLNERYREKTEGQAPDPKQETYDPQVLTRITAPLYVSTCEITREQWSRVMGTPRPHIQESSFPQTSVSWNDAQVFLTNLCQLEGVSPGTYRLLTEAEWEYCCRAGSHAPFYGSSYRTSQPDLAVLNDIAWFFHSDTPPFPRPFEAGLKEPNAFGLHDMIGNVWEWCSDRISRNYPNGPLIDPKGPGQGTARACRGGSWLSKPQHCRAAARAWNSDKFTDDTLGIRIARIMPESISTQPELHQ